MDNANPVATPADVNVKLRKSDGVSKSVDQHTYQSMVGSLLYAAMATGARHSSGCECCVKVQRQSGCFTSDCCKEDTSILERDSESCSEV